MFRASSFYDRYLEEEEWESMAFADAREIFEVRWRVQYYIISFSDLSLSSKVFRISSLRLVSLSRLVEMVR